MPVSGNGEDNEITRSKRGATQTSPKLLFLLNPPAQMNEVLEVSSNMYRFSTNVIIHQVLELT